jgi:AcrR family transcriptional regulator
MTAPPGPDPTPPTRSDFREAAEMGLRERKKLQTREALGWAAMNLAATRGLENVRVEDIAAAAGVSPRTFNNYFSSREEAITSVASDRNRRIGLALLARPAGERLDAALTEAVVEEYLHGREPDKKSALQTRMIVSHPALRGEFLKNMAAGEGDLAHAIAIRGGYDQENDLFPRILASAVIAAARVATEYWLRPTTDEPYSDLLRQAVSIAAALAVHQPPAPAPGPGPSGGTRKPGTGTAAS